MKMDLKFAAFIMTFQRVSILEDTIRSLFEQSVPPQKILIVDNDAAQSAKCVATKFENFPVEYIPMGYNSGPAGAAKKGLEILSEQDFQWIAWMDDDDPPIFPNTFEILLQLANSNKNCGCVGNVGQRFNTKNGLMIRIPDALLDGNGTLEVDNIAGNMCKIVNADVCRLKNVYPDEDLFFGFEELDFDLRIKEAGYSILVDKVFYKKHRLYWSRTNLKIKKGTKKDEKRIWRDYYSLRNNLIILRKHALHRAVLASLMRAIIKMVSGYRFGFSYGFKNFQVVLKAVIHFIIGKKGKIAV